MHEIFKGLLLSTISDKELSQKTVLITKKIFLVNMSKEIVQIII